jgi:hypothetical protein
MKKLILLFVIIGFFAASLTSCTENYSNGERIGFVTKFSRKGLVSPSWEGELNLTQTGMNTSSLFEFSVDNDNEDPAVIAQLDSAATQGWKVKLSYHETFGKNWFGNRGSTNYFVKEVTVLDRKPFSFNSNATGATGQSGKVIDTIYVIIVPKPK